MIVIGIYVRFILLFLFFIIPAFWAYLINVIGDLLDCPLEFNIAYILGKPTNLRCNTGWESYRVVDILQDIQLMLVSLFFVPQFSPTGQLFCYITFWYRMIGVILTILTRDSSWFFYFPNFYNLAFLLSSFESIYYKNLLQKSFIYPIIILAILFKIITEYLIHVQNKPDEP